MFSYIIFLIHLFRIKDITHPLLSHNAANLLFILNYLPLTTHPTITHSPNRHSFTQPSLIHPTVTHSPNRHSFTQPSLIHPIITHSPNHHSFTHETLIHNSPCTIPPLNSLLRLHHLFLPFFFFHVHHNQLSHFQFSLIFFSVPTKFFRFTCLYSSQKIPLNPSKKIIFSQIKKRNKFSLIHKKNFNKQITFKTKKNFFN